jgi:hypothetical protein
MCWTNFHLQKKIEIYLQHNNIRGVRLSGGVGWCWSSFPSIRPVIRPVIRPSKFLILAEEDDGRVYLYKKISVGVLMQLFLIGWSPPSPTSMEGPSQSERMVGWSTSWEPGKTEKYPPLNPLHPKFKRKNCKAHSVCAWAFPLAAWDFSSQKRLSP